MPSTAIVLFSGGIDSTTTLAVCIQEGYHPVALSFDYGQRHRVELEKGREVLRQFGAVESVVFPLDLRWIGGSALTSDMAVPQNETPGKSIPITYVPGRNLMFLAIAAALGESRGAYDLFYGANVLDYSGYPDCRPEFIESLERTLQAGTKAGVEGRRFRIHAPLLRMTKAEIIRRGIELGVNYTHTHSCYDPSPEGLACGRCDSCRIRLKGFREAGLADPVLYQEGCRHE